MGKHKITLEDLHRRVILLERLISHTLCLFVGLKSEPLTLEEMESHAIQSAMVRNGGIQKYAARELGISERTMSYILTHKKPRRSFDPNAKVKYRLRKKES